MKLNEMPTKPSLKKLNKITETRFGVSIDYDSITLPKAMKMRNKILETVNSIRRTPAIHTAERNPKYLEMLMIYEGLSRWIDAYNEQRPKSRRKVFEGEVGQAQAILAAKDMVDTVQDLIEKVGKMQNEQLPALIDSIRDQIGLAQADQFKGAVGESLSTMASTLSQAREQLDSAARTLAGEEGVAPDMASMPGPAEPDMMGGMGAAPTDDVMAEPSDGFNATPPAAGGAEEVGRERR